MKSDKKMADNRFVEYNVSMRIGKTILKPEFVNESTIIKEVEKFNELKNVEEVPEWINPEILNIEKVAAWFLMISEMDMNQFINFKERTIYLNHEAYQLTYTAPTHPASYNSGVVFDFTYDQSALSRPIVDFGQGVIFEEEIYVKSKDFLYEMIAEVRALEKKLNGEELIENSKEHAETLDQLLLKKYARFCAVKAVKRNLEILVTDQENEVLETQLQEVNAMFNDFIVPPIN